MTAARMDDGARPGDGAPGAPGEAPRFLTANLGVILLVTLAAIAGAAAISWAKTPLFTSIAEVIVQPRSYTSGGAAQLPDMATEKALASSGTVLGTASSALGVPAQQLSKALVITVPVDTRVLRIAYSYPNRLEARRRAEGIAEAYVANANQNEPAAQPHASIITDASLPLAPSSPRHVIDVGVGLVLGLALGFGVALIRDRRDDRFRSLADFEAHVGAPVLGVIPVMPRAAIKASAGLVKVGDTNSDAAAAYGDLRTRLLQIADRENAKTVLVASPVGETKAAVAANLATQLAMSGRHVALVLAEVRPPRVLRGLGVEDGPGLTDLASGDVTLPQALRGTGVVGLQVLTAGSRVRDPGVMFQARAMRQPLGELRESFDLIVFAAPPVLAGADTSVLAESLEMILLVGDAQRSTRAEVVAATHELGTSHTKLIGCVLDSVGKSRPWTRLRRPFVSQSRPAALRQPKIGEANRTAWLIDKNGKIRKIYPEVTPLAPAGEVASPAKQAVGRADPSGASPVKKET